MHHRIGKQECDVGGAVLFCQNYWFLTLSSCHNELLDLIIYVSFNPGYLLLISKLQSSKVCPFSSADMIGLGYSRQFVSSCKHFLFWTQNLLFLKQSLFELDILLRDQALSVGVRRQEQIRKLLWKVKCEDSFGPMSEGDHWLYGCCTNFPVMKEHAHISVLRNIILKAPGVINSCQFTLALSC